MVLSWTTTSNMPLQKQKSPASSIENPATPDTIIIPPPLQFIGRQQNLKDLVQTYSLPRVIKCDSKTGPNKADLRSNLDIRQPLLAFTVRSVTKVSAHSLVFDKQQNDFITVGNGLLIPEDYPGWFAVLGDPNKITQKDLVIPVYSKLSLLAVSKCSQFLVGGRDPVQALMFQTEHGSASRTMHIPVLPGTVLRCAGLYLGEYGTAKKKKKKEAPKVEEFLKCYDESDRALYLHMRQTGVFYVISKDGSAAATQIMTMKDILERFRLPLVVKLIYGRVPTTPCAFTQVLLLTDQGKSETLIASTLLCYRNINFEIPLCSKLQFQAAEQTPYLLDSRAYRRALESCKDKTPGYIKDMKVVFGDPQLTKNGASLKPDHASPQETERSQVYPGTNLPTVPQPSSNITTAKDNPNLPTVPQPPSDTTTAKARPNLPAVPQPPSDTTTAKARPNLPEVPQPSSHTNMTEAEESPSTEHVPKRSASVMCRKSYLSDMSKHLTIHEDNLILADQPSLPESPSPPSPPDVDDDIHMLPVTTYTPPQPITIGQTTHVLTPRESGNNPNVVYDNKEKFYNNKHPYEKCASHQLDPNTPDDCTCPTPPKPPQYPKTPESPPVCPRTHETSPESHRTPREKENIIKSTISIPFKPGRPQSPNTQRKPPDYLPMHGRADQLTTPHVNPHRKLFRHVSPLVNLYRDEIPPPLPHYPNVNFRKNLFPPSPPPSYKRACDTPNGDNPHNLTSSTDDYSTPMNTQNVYAQIDPPDQDKTDDTYIDPSHVAYPQCAQHISPTEPPASTFGLANKEMLIEELKKAGINSETELALRGLQSADIMSLLDRKDSFDDHLVHLLPTVGKFDLANIATCFRNMKLQNWTLNHPE